MNFILRMIHRRDTGYHVTYVIKTNTKATEVYSQSLRAEKKNLKNLSFKTSLHFNWTD